MCDKMCNIMVKATSRSVHHAFAKYLNLAHEGEQIVITKRGKPWASLTPIPVAKQKPQRKVVWPDIVKRAKLASGGKTYEAVKAYLEMREEARW
jgi:antitoxin (DNA-binding transcriptional repressor) of toxin-antitoxin stability system